MRLSKVDLICLIDEGCALIRLLDTKVNTFANKDVTSFTNFDANEYTTQGYLRTKNELLISMNLLENSMVRDVYDSHTEKAVEQYNQKYKNLKTWM